MKRLIVRLATVFAVQSFCQWCGAGPYSESEIGAHMRAAHPELT